MFAQSSLRWKYSYLLGAIVAFSGTANVCRAQEPGKEKAGTTLFKDLKNPQYVTIWKNRTFVTTMDDGKVWTLRKNQQVVFADGLTQPRGLVGYQNVLYVVDAKGVHRFDQNGRGQLVLPNNRIARNDQIRLIDIDVDEKGNLYSTVIVSGDTTPHMVITIAKNGRVTSISSVRVPAELQHPIGLAVDGLGHMLTLDGKSGWLGRINAMTKADSKVMDGFGGGFGDLAYDHFGRLFLCDPKNGTIYGIPRPGEKAVEMARGYKNATGLCVDNAKRRLLIANPKLGMVTTLPTTIPGWEVDESPLPIETAVAFPNLKYTNWESVSPAGKFIPMRPIVLTHAGDGSDRIFIATQRGMIHVIPNDPQAKTTKLFLDIRDRVIYRNNMNEEGFLGLAFHPQYKKNGEFYVYYSTKKANHTSVISRFRVSKDDPNRADMESEEVLMTIKQPFWNHNGGTIEFGPDGYLYIALGDGGAANDPYRNGQNLKTWLGSILRIDVDRKADGKNYAIPKDNPLVGKEGVQPEIYAYGLRNVWRLGFDKKTGQGWIGEVGQNLYEEINLLKPGANYGWNLRESFHPFGKQGVDVRKDLIDPIWEYHHNVGKSITGGSVYRGKLFPEMDGSYLYSDYVSGKIWALRYDAKKQRVTANRPISSRPYPWLSFGEDERGEVYLLSDSGRNIFRLVKKK